VQRAKRGLGVSVVPFVVGGILMTVGTAGHDCLVTRGPTPERCDRFLYSGIALTAVGGAGMLATGILLGVRKAKLRRLRAGAFAEGDQVVGGVYSISSTRVPPSSSSARPTPSQ
jgi:hypothetical protein